MNFDDKEAKKRIAKRVAQEFIEDDTIEVINLGVGIPTLVANYIDNSKICIQTENGMLGVGPEPAQEEADDNLINAGRIPVSETKGCSYFDSAISFGMINGGHIDATAIGALQVDEGANIANWRLPNSKQLGVGGAMDLVSGVKKVVIATRHTTKTGEPKIVKKCSSPVTGFNKASLIVTELAVFEFINNTLTLKQKFPDVSIDTVKSLTEADFKVIEKHNLNETTN